MEQNRFRLRGTSLAQLGAQALELYGPTARIVATERISAKGVAGFFGRAYYEATVEVTSSTDGFGQRKLLPPPPKKNFEVHGERQNRSASDAGSAAPQATTDTHVIQNDEGDTVALAEKSAAVDYPEPPQNQLRLPSERMRQRGALDEQDEDFGRMMDQLWKALREPGPEAAGDIATPAPLQAPGAVVVVAGLRQDASQAAAQLGLTQAVQWNGADYEGQSLRDIRRSLLPVRAAAVAAGVPVLALVTLKFPRGGVRSGADLPVITEADQLWAAVDASRKVEDTRSWLRVLAESRAVDGVLSLAEQDTQTPVSVHQLGLPVLAQDRGLSQ